MSVVVATAYMDEAQRFDWLMAMDDGKIIAHGTLQEMLDKAGQPTLEEAFIALLPEQKRALHQKVIVRPRVAGPDEVPAIEAEGIDAPVRRFRRRRSRQLPHRAGRNLRLPRLERLRQVDDNENAHRISTGN